MGAAKISNAMEVGNEAQSQHQPDAILLSLSVDTSLPLPSMTPRIIDLCKGIFKKCSNLDASRFSVETVSGGITNLWINPVKEVPMIFHGDFKLSERLLSNTLFTLLPSVIYHEDVESWYTWQQKEFLQILRFWLEIGYLDKGDNVRLFQSGILHSSFCPIQFADPLAFKKLFEGQISVEED